MKSLNGLPGKTVYLRRSGSCYENWESLNYSLRQAGASEVGIALVEEQLEDEDILEMVNAGLFTMTIIDEEKGLDPTWFDNVQVIAALEIGQETADYVSNIYKYYTSYLSLARCVVQTGKNPFERW